MGKAGRKHLWESDGNGNTSLGPALCQGTMDDKNLTDRSKLTWNSHCLGEERA